MKKISLAVFLLSSFWLGAQFKVEGQLQNYPSKPVLIKIYENGGNRLVKRVETDKKGSFSYQHPQAYTGKMIFELSQGALEIVVDNRAVNFSTDVNDSSHQIHITQGIQKEINEAFALADKAYLRDHTLMELQKLYTPQDEFYQALQKEIERINKLAHKQFENSAIQYYVDAMNEMAQYNSGNMSHAEILTNSKNHLLMDNMNLENFGLLQGFLSTYVSYSLGGARNKEEAGQKIVKALDDLLAEAQTDTSRGQAILTNIIPLLEGNGFVAEANNYMQQAESLTCEISDDLKDLIAGKNNVKIGNKVPNIDFEGKVKSAKSLYDIQANQKLLVFWASWCPHCVNEIPHLKAFYPDFKAKGGEMIAISLDIERQPYEDAIRGSEWINYSDLMKWESPLVSKFGISSTPTFILLDKDNKVIKTGSRISEFL
ncbi:MAG: TlpA disulfide reductase family protein [Flavobacteriaceae bacterium]|nr:TlpA disulfide reductase family protein [Flavobacteriaceae bacterium]